MPCLTASLITQYKIHNPMTAGAMAMRICSGAKNMTTPFSLASRQFVLADITTKAHRATRGKLARS
jgi:hypothetical protein